MTSVKVDTVDHKGYEGSIGLIYERCEDQCSLVGTPARIQAYRHSPESYDRIQMTRCADAAPIALCMEL